MGEIVNLDVTTLEESVSVTTTDGGTVEVAVQAEKGDTGPAGPAGPNTVTSATTSDGTANLSLSNVTTATATVTGTLTASHIHGNLAGSVYAHVRAGENLDKGDPVYISGSHGSGASLIAIVSKADASNAAKMPAVGVMDADVTANSNGHMVITGTITELDTNAFAVNAELYVDAGGGFTSTPPTGLCQPVARVERSNTNNGAVIVKVNGLSSKSAIDNTLVRRGANGDVSFATSSNDTITLNLESNGDFAGITYPSAVKASASGLNGIGADIYSNSGWGAVIASNTNTGALISTNSGTYHADFGSGDNRSAIERIRGWFVWFYNTFTGRLKTADITANRDWTLPDASGTIALTVSTAINEKIEMQGGGESGFVAPNYYAFAANSASLRDGNTGLACLTWGASGAQNLTVPSGTALTFDNTSFTYGTGAASAHRTALGLTALATTTPGTGVATALAVNVGSAGAFVVNGGALGTPSSGTLTSCTGLPISTGVSGLAANVATFLATPSSANLAAALTDENGTGGGFVRAESPTLSNPTASTASASATALIVTGPTTGVDTLQVRGTTASSFSSIGLMDNNNVQRASFGYGGSTASSYASTAFFNSGAGIPMTFGVAGNEAFRMSASRGMSIGTTADAGFSNLLVAGSGGFGTTSANNARAILQADSTTRGFLPPRMTTAQRDAISSPPAGLMIYNTTTNKLNFYNGSAWEAVTSA